MRREELFAPQPVADRDELAELRQRVDCRTVLERAGWELDARESTRQAAKYRQGAGRIVIVTHEGRGWFAPLDDKRGDVIALAQHVWGGNLGHTRRALRPLAGIVPQPLPALLKVEAPPLDGEAVWRKARLLRAGSSAWRYLTEERGLSANIVERVAQAGALREGICGTVWAQHQAVPERVTGWEMRGPRYKGFSKGGAKTLFRVGYPSTVSRVAVTESAIDAMSLAGLEGWAGGTVYVSTGGGYGAATEEALCGVLLPDVELAAATDRGTGGELLATRLGELARACGARFSRLWPDAKDWNAQLTGRSI